MATDGQLQTYYANLLILQYRSKPKAFATIRAVAKAAIINQIPLAVQDAFNLDTAIGVQLDVLGKYAGVTRNGYDFSGPVTLDDENFRQLIKIQIIQNSSGSSLADIDNLLEIFFENVIFVFDHKDMRMSYYIDSNEVSTELAEFFVMGGFLPRPMGVQLSAIIYAPVLDTFFGFRTYYAPAYNVSPFNTYADYEMDTPWLSYANAIAIP